MTDRHGDRTIRQANDASHILVIIAALIVSLLVGFNLPAIANQPAQAAVRPAAAPTAAIAGRVDICAVEVPKSWTKKLQKKANKAFHQKVRVHRVTEYTLADHPCDLFMWTTGSRNKVGLSPEDASFEKTVTASKRRPQAVVKALRDLGVR